MNYQRIPSKYLSFFDLEKFNLKNNKLLLVIFVLLTVQYIAFYYINEGILSRIFLYVFYVAAVVAPLLLLTKVRIEWNYFSLLFVGYFLFMLFNSVLNLSGDIGEDIASITIYLAFITGMILSRFSTYFLFLSGRILAVLGLIGLAYILSVQNINITNALSRGYTWTEIFYYSSLFWCVIPFVLMAFLRRKAMILAVLYWIGAIVLNLLFLKRFILVDSILLIAALAWIQYMRERSLKLVLRIAGVALVVLAVVTVLNQGVFATLLSATTDRIESTSDNLDSFDRWVESSNYLSDAGLGEKLLGKGFASVHHELGKSSSALHIGWTNLIFKGGIILLFFVLFVYAKVFKLLGSLRYQPLKIQFSVLFLLVYFFRLFYTNMHNLSPELMVFSYALFTVVNYKSGRDGRYIQSLHEVAS